MALAEPPAIEPPAAPQPEPPAAPANSGAGLGTLLARWGIGLALGALFTWYSARNWPIDELFGGVLTLGRVAGDWAVLLRKGNGPGGSVQWSLDLWALASYLLILFVIHWLRVLRWKPLLQPYADVPIPVLNRVGAAGFMFVFLLPFRLGELARPLMLARGSAVPFGAGLGSIAIERILDGLTTTLILFAVLVQVHPATLARHPEVHAGAWAAFALFATALAGLFATLVARDFTLRMVRRIVGVLSPGLAEKLIGLVTAFVDGLKVLRSPWLIAEFVGMTVTYWGLNGLGIYLFARGFGLDLPVVAAYAMMSCLVVGMMIPNAPASVGSFWVFLLAPAGLYGIATAAPRTIAFALALWFVQTLQVTLFGLWGWWADAKAAKAR